MMILMTILAKKAFISSKYYRLFSMPASARAFLYQESAVGGLSYKVKKSRIKMRLFIQITIFFTQVPDQNKTPRR